MELTETERMELQRQASARTARADAARHARLILLLSEGLTWAEIRAKLDCSDSYIDRWSKRFAADRLAGLFARNAGRERYKVTERSRRAFWPGPPSASPPMVRRTGRRGSSRPNWAGRSRT